MSYVPQVQMPVGVQPQEEEPLRLVDDPSGGPDTSTETMTARADKFKYGLGDLLSKTRDEIYQDIQDGNESQLRAQSAGLIDERKRSATTNLITKVTANKQGPLTPEERSGLVQMVQDMNATTNPDTVMEAAYAKQFMGTLDRVAQGNPDSVWTDITKIHPEWAAQMTNGYSDLMTKHQVIDTLIEDQHDKLRSQGWAGYGLDVTKGFIPGYEDYNLRGQTPEVGSFDKYGLGANLDETRKALLRLPTDEMHEKLKDIVANLETGILGGNPQLALTFLESMKGMTADEKTIRNWSGPVDIAGTIIGSKTAKLAVKGIMGQAERAVQDITRAAATPGASRSTIEAAAGDLQESAITRATAGAVADAHNVPDATRRGVAALSSTHRADIENIRANPGTYGQDIVNRIEERGNSVFTNLMDAATNIQKNERLPEVLANETATRVIVEDMKGKYTGLRNTVIDSSPIYREPLSNTYLIDLHLGTNEGTYFAQRSVADNHIAFHKLGGADVVEATTDRFTPSVVQENKYTKNIAISQKIIEREQGRMSAAGATDAQKAKSAEQIALAEDHIVDQAAQRHALVSARRQTATVEQQGLGFYIKITKPIDETSPAIRNAIAQTGNTKIPDSPVAFFLNNWIGKYVGAAAAKYRTPEEVLSRAERANRLTTTYAPSVYFKVMAENAQEIKGIQRGRFSRGRKRWVEWQRGLENAQELPDALDPARKGYFFKDPVEMEHHWQQWFQRLPDQDEVAAYFEFKRGMEVDRVFRNIAEQRNAQRLGNETHSIILRDSNGQEVRSEKFRGKQLDHLPGSSDNVAIFSGEAGKERLAALGKLSVKEKQELNKDIQRGHYKAIELYNPAERPLNGFSSLKDERIRYVLTHDLETEPLDWNHVPRRGGGHVQYEHDFWLKQAKIHPDSISGEHWYEGDTTIMAVPTQGIGSKVAEHLNQVRKLLKSRNEDAARAYSNQHLHVGWDEVKSWFVGKLDENAKYQVPRLSLNEDIHVVPNNRRVIDHDNELKFRFEKFRDGTKEGSMASQNVTPYTQERDAFEVLGVNVEGTKANPLYRIAPADKVDPITTMNRGLASIVRSNFMDDYKTMAVEHWLAQAKGHLEVKTEAELYHSPYYYFNEGKFLKNTPADVQLRLEANKYHIGQLTGQPSLVDGLLHSAAQKLADSSFRTFGPKGLVLTPTWILPKLHDPFGFARSIAFNMKLGLFNIPQFMVQAGNYANIMGIAGHKYATPGTLAAQLHFWSTVNSHPAILNHLDGIASKMYIPGASRWKPGEFREALQEMHLTGFGHVGNEMAMMDSPMNTKLITKGGQTFLDWGAFPFKAGERNARYGAWYTAFKEFRDANPLGRITQADRAAILQRADLLNINMSRASSSALHKGILSIPTQFYTYQIRLTELMFGGRLTGYERARLMMTNAALYGVPMSAGITSLPLADYLRGKAMEHGYVVGDDMLYSTLMEGIPAAVGAFITGHGDPHKGNWYDVGPRYGTKGLEFLGRATGGAGDKGWLDVLGGPIYSIAKNTWQLSDGLMYAMGSLMRGDGAAFPMVTEDVADVFREITSFNAAWRVYAASQYGRWVSRKDAYLADATTGQAIFGATTGLKETGIDDIQIMLNSIKGQQDYEKEIEDRFRQEFRRGVLAQNDNPELAKKFFTRAQAWIAISGYREDRISSLLSKALGDNQSILDKTRWDFYIRKTPDAQAKDRYKALQKTLKLDDMKRGE